MPHKSDTPWKSLRVIIALIVLVIILALLYFLGKKRPSEDVHYHAGFKIYVDHNIQDFSKSEYMHIDPCSEEVVHEEDIPQERAHLHDGIGDVVHVHSQRATWGDLLTTLRFSKEEKDINFYLNGQKTSDLTDVIIKPYDRMLLLIGKGEASQEELDSVPAKDMIEQAEKNTESC